MFRFPSKVGAVVFTVTLLTSLFIKAVRFLSESTSEFLVILAILTITILCYAFIKPDRFYERLDSALYKVFK